jgi:GNAT superfamily N-acetyltransferase
MSVDFRLGVLDNATLRAAIPQLAALLQTTVAHGSSVSFIHPLSAADAAAFWARVADEAAETKRIVLAAWFGTTLAGTAQLVPASVPNGRHRAEVQKVLVHPTYRRRGIGLALMNALEIEARARGIRLLVLDTEAGRDGEGLYAKAGWQRSGHIPGYAYDSTGMTLIDTVVYYKTLV